MRTPSFNCLDLSREGESSHESAIVKAHQGNRFGWIGASGTSDIDLLFYDLVSSQQCQVIFTHGCGMSVSWFPC